MNELCYKFLDRKQLSYRVKGVERMKKLSQVLALLVVWFGLSMVFGGTDVYAQDSIFVQEKAGILSDKDKAYIHELNETTFKQLEGEPQYAVVTLKRIKGESIESYAEKKFQEMGVGNKEVNNGFLFVISLEDRQYRLETGYGVEAVITDGMKDDVITDQVEDYLKAEQYEKAVMAVSQNIEQLINDRYGNYAASVLAIQNRKARNKQLIRIVLVVFVSLGLIVLLIFLSYLLRKKRIQNQLERYVSPTLQVQVYRHPRLSAEVTLNNRTVGKFKNDQLSKVAAKKMIRNPDSSAALKDEWAVKELLTIYLVEDAIIAYWSSNQTNRLYDVDVYLEDETIKELASEYGDQFFSSQLMTKNPMFSTRGQQLIDSYMTRLTVKHQQALEITEQNKALARKASSAFLTANQVTFNDGVDRQLMVALMTYFLLDGRNLAEEGAVDHHLLSEMTLSTAYKKAKKKRHSIESGYRRQALSDLDHMVIGSYYMQQAIIWSSYSSSSSSDGGASFGGGSSGGGGFSGGW